MPKPYSIEDEYYAGNKQPRAVGNYRLAQLNFSMDMTDEQMRALAEEAIAIKNEFSSWDEFYNDLDLRKRRNLGFKAAVLALDLQQAAAAMGTSPQKIVQVMSSYANAEDARIAELNALWEAGELPDRDVLNDPSKEVVKDQG